MASFTCISRALLGTKFIRVHLRALYTQSNGIRRRSSQNFGYKSIFGCSIFFFNKTPMRFANQLKNCFRNNAINPHGLIESCCWKNVRSITDRTIRLSCSIVQQETGCDGRTYLVLCCSRETVNKLVMRKRYHTHTVDYRL